jgi:HSP20 family molecular chaperone IbpA
MNFDDVFKEMEEFQRRMMQSFKLDFDELEKRLESGKLKGEWKLEPIERPGMRGFIARGFFATPEPLERPEGILPPLSPKLREPTGPREPLYDISVREGAIQVFIELPGVDESEIELKVEDGRLGVEAGDFRTEIDLSAWIVDSEGMTTGYRNGVLTVSIPKKGLDEKMV